MVSYNKEFPDTSWLKTKCMKVVLNKWQILRRFSSELECIFQILLLLFPWFILTIEIRNRCSETVECEFFNFKNRLYLPCSQWRLVIAYYPPVFNTSTHSGQSNSEKVIWIWYIRRFTWDVSLDIISVESSEGWETKWSSLALSYCWRWQLPPYQVNLFRVI